MTTEQAANVLAEDAAAQCEATAAALARNDAYVRGFVEQLGLCPYARRCREAGRLHRRVLFSEAAAAGAVAELEALPADAVEVALLIFPRFDRGARAFEAFRGTVREQMAGAHPAGEPPFFCVAFHPDLPMDLGDAHRAVHFIRRSPDPTLQLVRASVLRQVRAGRTGGSTFVDTRRLTAAELMALEAPAGLSDQIAEANLAALRRAGPERLAAALASLRAG